MARRLNSRPSCLSVRTEAVSCQLLPHSDATPAYRRDGWSSAITVAAMGQQNDSDPSKSLLCRDGGNAAKAVAATSFRVRSTAP